VKKHLGRIFVLFDNAESLDDGLSRTGRADAILYSLNQPQVERLALFVGAS
jgi:hypothetical protein